MTAAALAVATPHHQWYSLLLVMLVALDGRPEWLAFAAGGYYAGEAGAGPVRRAVASARRHRLRRAAADRVAASWLIRHELARRAVTAEPLPAVAEPAVAGGPPRRSARKPASPGKRPASEPGPGVRRRRGPRSPGLTRAVRVSAFLPVGYPPGKHQTAPATRTVNKRYEFRPVASDAASPERWPYASPAGGWPSYRDPEEEQADRLDAFSAAAGYRRGASYQHASGGSSNRGHQSAVATAAFPLAGTGYDASGGYGPAGYGPAGYGDAREGYEPGLRTATATAAETGTPRPATATAGPGGNGNGYRTGGYASGGYPGATTATPVPQTATPGPQTATPALRTTSLGLLAATTVLAMATPGTATATTVPARVMTVPAMATGRNGNGYVQASNGYADARERLRRNHRRIRSCGGRLRWRDGRLRRRRGQLYPHRRRLRPGKSTTVNGYDWNANGYDGVP